jgi:uncharacterized membrane protein YozB (DUF420 family)
MDYYLLVSTLTLLLQVATFLLVAGGFLFRKWKRFWAHGFAMFAAVVLHLFSVLVIMVPSFVEGIAPFIGVSLSPVLSVVSFVHVVFGGLAAVLGSWIVFSWRLRSGLQFCAPKRRWMRFTLWVWLSSLVLGFFLYLTLFWQSLFG